MTSSLKTEPWRNVATAPPAGRGWLVAVGLLVGVIALVGIPARSTYGAHTSADEPQYLLSAISLAEDADLDISDELREERYRPFHEIALDQQTIELDDTGRQVSPHDPLLPILLAVPMAIGGWVGAKAALAGVAAATAVLTAVVASRRLRIDRSVAAIATVSCFAGLPLAGYGAQVYPEMPAALLTLVLIAGLTRPTISGSSMTLTLVALVGLPWLAVKYVPIAAVGGVVLLWRLRQRHRLLLGTVLVTALAAVSYLAAHQWIYGGWTVYAAGDHFVSDGEFAAVGTNVDVVGRSRRLVGLLVDRQFGIASWSPVWFLLPIAVVTSLRDRSPASRLLVGLLAAGWLTASFVALTMHGWWLPGRQLVVALPVAAMLIAQWADRSAKRMLLVAALGLAGLINWLWLAIEASTGRRALIVDFHATASWPYRMIAPLLPDGTAGDTRNDVLLIVWALAIVAVIAVAQRGLKRSRTGRVDGARPSSMAARPRGAPAG